MADQDPAPHAPEPASSSRWGGPLWTRVDAVWARAEAALATGLLLAMVVVAATQALLRNLATRLELTWAQGSLANFTWADPFLQKSTLWVAFVGASLATYEQRHIAIDILPRVAPPRLRRLMRGMVGLSAGAIAFVLAWVFGLAVVNNGLVRPLEYEVLTPLGPAHVCDVGNAVLDASHLERPTLFCSLRWLLAQGGLKVESMESLAQWVAPVMFGLIGLRLLAQGCSALTELVRGPAEPSAG